MKRTIFVLGFMMMNWPAFALDEVTAIYYIPKDGNGIVYKDSEGKLTGIGPNPMTEAVADQFPDLYKKHVKLGEVATTKCIIKGSAKSCIQIRV